MENIKDRENIKRYREDIIGKILIRYYCRIKKLVFCIYIEEIMIGGNFGDEEILKILYLIVMCGVILVVNLN